MKLIDKVANLVCCDCPEGKKLIKNWRCILGFNPVLSEKHCTQCEAEMKKYREKIKCRYFNRILSQKEIKEMYNVEKYIMREEDCLIMKRGSPSIIIRGGNMEVK
jgi:hypothetical protein